MAIPPPPGPPKPPPPPAMGSLKLNFTNSNNNSGGNAGKGGVPSTDARSALLQSIQKGIKLKKTVTVDKSLPITAGKILNESSSPSKPLNSNSSVSSTPQRQITNGGPKLAGLFEGMTSMPKLKPVNGRDNVPSSRTTTMTNNVQDIRETNNNNCKNNNGPMDFSTELSKHLAQTLKRQKQNQQQQHTVNATEANLRTNRGPPPKPPIFQKNLISSTSDSVLEKSSNMAIATTTSSSKSSFSSMGGSGKASSPTLSEGSNVSTSSNSMKKNSNFSLSLGNSNISKNSYSSILQSTTTNTLSTPTMHIPLPQNNLLPNKSTLFGTNTSSSSKFNSNNYNSNSSLNKKLTNSENHPPFKSSQISSSLLSSTSSSISSKPVINYGKPNCAPKPPGIQQLMSSSGKPTVSRHHSMKSSRSPPISTNMGGGSTFSTAQYFGTLRGPPQMLNQQNETIITPAVSLIITRQAPNPPIGRPTEAPPKPPSSKPAPPPIPARSVSNTNLTNLPLSTVSSSSNVNTFGSTNNVSSETTIRDNLRIQKTYVGSTINLPTLKISANVMSAHISNISNNISNNCSDTSNNSLGKLSSPIHGGSNKSGGGNSSSKSFNLNSIPPVPSHRTQPAPDPPQRQISSNTSSNLIPPKPPERHSSVRSNSTTGNIGVKITYNSQISNNNMGGNNSSDGTTNVNNSNTGLVNRLITDIESRYNSKFHNVTEFPSPPPFLNTPKTYPSRNVNNGT